MLVSTIKYYALGVITAGALSANAALPQSAELFSLTNNPAATPAPKNEKWVAAHWKRDKALQNHDFDILLIGDSITHGWKRHPAVLKEVFQNKKVVNLGHSADKTENILWRMGHHRFDDISPEYAVVMVGTNNTNHDAYSVDEIAGGVAAIVQTVYTQLPQTQILLFGIFPRGSHDQRVQISKGLTQAKMNPQWEKIDRVNQKIKALADAKRITYININANFLNAQGELPLTNMPDLLHLSEAGYQVGGDAIKTAIN